MNNLTELVFILDKSGSMCNGKRCYGRFNSMIKDEEKKAQARLFSTFLFSDGMKNTQTGSLSIKSKR